MGRQSLRTRASRVQSTAADITEQRATAIESMNRPLLQKFNRIENAVNDMRAQNLRFYHQLGKICHEISEDPGRYVGRDGTPALTLIERALSTQARTLRKATEFARKYDDNELEHLIGLFNTDTNYQLNWGHVSYLLSLPTPTKRQQFAEEAVEKMLDPGALHALIRRRTGRTGGHGRKHEMPKTVEAQIRQVLSESTKWLRKSNEVWAGSEESVFGNILNLPAEKMDQEMVEQLEEIRSTMLRIAEAANSNVARAVRAKEYLENSLAEQAAQLAAVEEMERNHGRPSRDIDLSPVG